MKFKLLLIMFLFAFISGCTRMDSLGDNNKTSVTNIEAQTFAENFRIVNSHATVKVGEMGFITIQGQPGVKYTIESSYKIKNKIMTVSQWRIAEANGEATFNWVVSRDTVPGTYGATISGDGEKINVTHTVIP